MTLKQVQLYDAETGSFRAGSLSWENGRISDCCLSDEASDGEGDLILPGLIDVHTHGRGGYDFNDATADELLEMKRLYAERGVTTVVPTLASDTFDNMLLAIRRIREAGFCAVHVEGRYLSPNRRGAHAAALIAPLNPEEVADLRAAAGEMHLHLSAAYERDPDGAFLAAVKANGATAGLAHTDATYEEAMTAVSRGLRSFTHLFNTMPAIHHRKGGAILAGLLSDAYTEIICDGFHLAPETVALVNKAKSPSRVVLITDSMAGTACPDGNYAIAGSPVILRGGKAYTEEGAIAGSTLELLDGVKNYAAFCHLPFAEAVAAATANPAAMLGLSDIGSLKTGYRADFIRLSPSLELKEVYVGGVRVK
ncbi:MAG: N-acetylglucosamine-6-phosphate deacetylase [Ruminococcaceae bacterium]|nr:N-acetylglucosamine-6-phosphate deacetylase [Oscillospiraceae bacterium]